MSRADALRPMHRSVLEKQARARGYRPRPVNMSAVALPDEARECIERIALGIFTDMVNSGATLQETLAAVYLSGSENALAAYREPANAAGNRLAEGKSELTGLLGGLLGGPTRSEK